MSLTISDRQIRPDSSDTSPGMTATIPLQPSQSSVLGLDPIHLSFLDPDPVLKLHVCTCATFLRFYEITIADNNTKNKCDFTRFCKMRHSDPVSRTHR
jgi:hypothetical protein